MLGRKITKQEEQLFTTPQAAPDAILNADEFADLTGINVNQSNILKDFATAETKVTGVGESGGLEITALQIGRRTRPEQFEAIQQEAAALGQKGLTGEKALPLIFSDGRFKDLRVRIVQTAQEKVENLLLVNTLDADKRPKPSIGFVPNALGGLPADTFTSAAVFSQFYKLNIKQKTKRVEGQEERELIAYRMALIPTAALYARLKKAQINITEKVKKAHQDVFKTNFSQGLLNYLVRNIPKEIAKKDVNGYFELIVGFAKEFERGGMTPFTIRTELIQNTPTPIEVNLKVKAKKAKSPQKFISGAQITALVQNRLRKVMPQGPRRGPPLSPNIMTNRTGRFRRSIQVIPVYRNNVIRYTYDPLYMSLLNTAYNPDNLVTRTIREVVQQLFNRQFAVTRGM